MLESTLQDLSFAVRMLRKEPAFSVVAALCLAIGIGANAAVFSWIEGILLRPYPGVQHQDRLFALAGTNRGESGFSGLSWPDLLDLRRSASLVDAFVVSKIAGTTLSVGERAEVATGSIVSANYFDALGVRPLLGRGFRPEEETGRNAHPVVVISERLWRERFDGDPAVIGRIQRLNGVPHEIVGVTPPGFIGTFVGYAIQFWVPASMVSVFEPGGDTLEDRGARWIESYALLKPGVDRRQAEEQIASTMRSLEAAHPDTNRGRGAALLPLRKTPFNAAGRMGPPLGVGVAVVIAVLLIACANVGCLLLVRAVARRRELTVRLAIGCSRGRLVRQLLAEGFVLSALGAAGGLLIASLSRNLLVAFFPSSPGIALHLGGALDGRVLAASVVVSVAATLLSSVAPAIQTRRLDVSGALAAEAAAVVGGRGRSRLRSGLVLVQVSLGFVLLVGAGLLGRSLQAIRRASPGFSTDVRTAIFDLKSAGYDERRASLFRDELLTRVRAFSGVASAAWARIRPFTYNPYSSTPAVTDGAPPPRDERPTFEYDEVGEGWLETMGIPLLEGRAFRRTDDENAPPVAVVNDTLAALAWPGRSAVGRRLLVKDRWTEVVGVARAVKGESMLEPRRPFFYVPLRQAPAARSHLFVKGSLGTGALAAGLAREAHALDAGLAPGEVVTMREQVDRMSSVQKMGGGLLALFGGIALLLAAVGLYGVVSYAVSQGARELGLRMALGATESDVLTHVLSRGLALTAAGMAIGAAAALAATRLVAPMLYGVGPRDPSAFGGALVVMTCVAAAACLVPAWRASRTDPALVLRQ